MQEIIADEKLEKRRRNGLFISLSVCVVSTVIVLILFSREGFHQQTDELFRLLIEQLTAFWNTGYGGIILLVCGLLVPLAELFLLPIIDSLTRRAPAGSFLSNNIKLNFELCGGLRFLPGFLVIIYFIIAGFMRNSDKSISFDPDSYSPFVSHSAGEWLNICFMALTIFSLVLIIIEGIVAAGPWGMLIHLPLTLAANIYFVVLVCAIMFIASLLFGAVAAIIVMSIIMPIFLLVLIIAMRFT